MRPFILIGASVNASASKAESCRISPSVSAFEAAVNTANGVYQAGDLAGLRHVGLSTGCLKKSRGFGRALPGYVPPPEASVRVESEVPGLS